MDKTAGFWYDPPTRPRETRASHYVEAGSPRLPPRTTGPYTNQWQGSARLSAARTIMREWSGPVGSEKFKLWDEEMRRQFPDDPSRP